MAPDLKQILITWSTFPASLLQHQLPFLEQWWWCGEGGRGSQRAETDAFIAENPNILSHGFVASLNVQAQWLQGVGDAEHVCHH